MFCQMKYRRIHNGEIEIPYDIYGKCKMLTTEEDGALVIRIWPPNAPIDKFTIKEALHIIAEEEVMIDRKKKKLRLPKTFLDYMKEYTKTAICGVFDQIQLMRARDYLRIMRETETDPVIQQMIDEILEEI